MKLLRKRPARGEALIYPGKADRHLNTKSLKDGPADEDLASYRALTLISKFGIRAELAIMLAPIAFEGSAHG